MLKVHRIIIFACFLALHVTAALAQSNTVAWESWSTLDTALLDDDGTGSTFALSELNGTPALTITPGGSSEETKLAYPVSGDDLQVWIDAGQIRLDVRLPEENALNPNSYFLGLADTTNEWMWIGGLFGQASGMSGEISVTFPVASVIGDVNPEGEYMLYLSFIHESGGSKIPLTEPFSLDAITLVSTEVASDDERYQQESEALLDLDDPALIDAIARETFDYFWLEANQENGLIKDRSTATSPASIAAVGFGLAAIPIGVERGWISESDGVERARVTMETFLNGGVQGEHGFFYHFVDMETGERVWDSELSSIDTALLVAGALVAGRYFEGTEVQTLADQLYENVEWDWMLNGGDFVRMGWKPESGFLGASWNHFDESMILYVLAIGSPTHPIPADAWDLWRRPVRISGQYIYLPGEPLFVYQYPQAFLKLRYLEDDYGNYWNNTTRACQRQQAFALESSDYFLTYQNGVWGLSASDGPRGYRAYGASDVNHDGTIAPYASAACLPFTPEAALDSVRGMLAKYGSRVWREYGLVSAINENEDWYSREHIGIDQGDILLMIANAQDGFVWDLFMANPPIQNALDAMGFTESSGDYAITPAYLKEVTPR